MNDTILPKPVFRRKSTGEVIPDTCFIPDALVILCRENLHNKMKEKEVIVQDNIKFLPFPKKKGGVFLHE